MDVACVWTVQHVRVVVSVHDGSIMFRLESW